MAVVIDLMNKTSNSGTPVSLGLTGDPAGWEIAGASDMNRDGNVDIILRNYNASSADFGKVRVWHMLGTTRYEIFDHLLVVADANWHLEGASDFNRDGSPDLLWHHATASVVGLWYMNYGTFQSGFTLPFPVPRSTFRVGATGDFNGDSMNDIIWRNITDGTNVIWYNDPNGTFVSANLPAVGDLNWQLVGPR